MESWRVNGAIKKQTALKGARLYRYFIPSGNLFGPVCRAKAQKKSLMRANDHADNGESMLAEENRPGEKFASL